jgi:peptide/nickel transport system substrate-binding protein
MSGRYTLTVLLVIAMLASVIGCAQPGPASEPTQAPATQPTSAPAEPTQAPAPSGEADGPKGTLTLAVAENPEFMDPTMSLQIFNWTISFSMFDTLVTIDESGEIVPSLAESWEAIEPTAWKFTLRKGVKFHDGTPFTSAAVKATLDHIVNPDVGSRQVAIWTSYDRTETPDDYTAIIYTKEPMGTLISNLALTCIIPPNTEGLNDHPIGTGPFKFVEWKQDDRVVVEANPDYWGGAPKLERIVFRTIPELATRISALERGEVDIVDLVPPEEFDRLEKAGINLINQPTTYLRFIWLGDQGPLADRRVRQAINLAIDRQAIIDELFQGVAFEVKGVVAPSVIGYCEMGELKYDPEQAKKLMQEAGVTGFDLELKTAEYLAKQKEMAEVIAAYLGEIGINVKVTVQEQALWIQDLMALNWEANQIGTSTLTGDADYTLRRLYHTDAKRTPHRSDRLDELLIAQMGETDPEKRQEMFCEIAEILWEEAYVIFLLGTVQTYGINPRVQNFEPRASQFMFFKDVSVQ